MPTARMKGLGKRKSLAPLLHKYAATIMVSRSTYSHHYYPPFCKRLFRFTISPLGSPFLCIVLKPDADRAHEGSGQARERPIKLCIYNYGFKRLSRFNISPLGSPLFVYST